ncbi:MAG: hypothetical protein Tsb002_37890 [Wenzhouxiangellaceae bacterium]
MACMVKLPFCDMYRYSDNNQSRLTKNISNSNVERLHNLTKLTAAVKRYSAPAFHPLPIALHEKSSLEMYIYKDKAKELLKAIGDDASRELEEKNDFLIRKLRRPQTRKPSI